MLHQRHPKPKVVAASTYRRFNAIVENRSPTARAIKWAVFALNLNRNDLGYTKHSYAILKKSLANVNMVVIASMPMAKRSYAKSLHLTDPRHTKLFAVKTIGAKTVFARMAASAGLYMRKPLVLMSVKLKK